MVQPGQWHTVRLSARSVTVFLASMPLHRITYGEQKLGRLFDPCGLHRTVWQWHAVRTWPLEIAQHHPPRHRVRCRQRERLRIAHLDNLTGTIDGQPRHHPDLAPRAAHLESLHDARTYGRPGKPRQPFTLVPLLGGEVIGTEQAARKEVQTTDSHDLTSTRWTTPTLRPAHGKMPMSRYDWATLSIALMKAAVRKLTLSAPCRLRTSRS
jgi:hypothetical protein